MVLLFEFVGRVVRGVCRPGGGITAGLLVWGVLTVAGLAAVLAASGLAPQAGMGLLVLVHALLTFVWLGGYVLLLAGARAFFERPAVCRALDRVTGVVLVGFGVKVATAQP